MEGRTLSHYRVLAHLGGGGMGVVRSTGWIGISDRCRAEAALKPERVPR